MKLFFKLIFYIGLFVFFSVATRSSATGIPEPVQQTNGRTVRQPPTTTSAKLKTDSWAATKASGKGTIVVFWYTSRPFIFANQEGEIDGIEYKIFKGFKNYLKGQYNIDLEVRWVKSKSFIDVLHDVRTNSQSGIFGASAFSITDERKKQVAFSPPYMPDISVMVSSDDVPIVSKAEDIRKTLSGLTAVTIKGTTYESDVLKLKSELNLDFTIEYIPSNDNIIKAIDRKKKAFGFIDLPIYLIQFSRNSSMGVKRQNLLPIKREGYAVIYPQQSDWNIPINEYFNSRNFKKEIETITSEYLDNNLYKFIEDLYMNAEKNVVLLTKEREMQYKEIQGKAEKLKRETTLRNYLTAAIFVIFIFLAIIFFLYRKVNRDNRMLSSQARKIASQNVNIERQKEQLEQRYERLTELNDEKNTLIKVLAHDLRSPINQIQGFANILLMENKNASEAQISCIHQILNTAVRVNGMIGKILDVDALESNRVNAIPEDIEIAQLTKQVVQNFQKEAAAKQINLYFFNSLEEHCILSLDRLYITQVIENLISNAIKFSEKKTNVKVSLAHSGNKIQMSVADEGPGFTDDDKKHLFQKFKQLSARPTNGEKSTGLGLSIVKKYVELMGGRIWCESEAGNGATFHIEFDQAKQPA